MCTFKIYDSNFSVSLNLFPSATSILLFQLSLQFRYLVSLYDLVSLLVNFQILNFVSEFSYFSQHFPLFSQASRVFAGLGLPKWALGVVSDVLVVINYLVTFWNVLTSERQLIDRIHNHAVDLAIFTPTASFRTGNFVMLRAPLAVET